MYSLVIKDKEYELPDTISISKWIALSNYDLDLQFTWDKVISISMDIPQEDVELIPLKTKELIILFIRGLMNPLITRKKDELNGGKYMNLSTITLGQFIDMEIYITDGIHKNIDDVIKHLYGVELNEDNTIKDILGGVNNYMKWRNNLYYSYKNLFNIGGNGYKEEEDEKYISIESVKKSWFDIIMLIADNDFLRMNDVVKQPLIQAFNWLAWNKEKKQKELDELQKHNRHY